jgi:Concanavalin A-like lectin/glucanases superfamily
MPAQPTLPPEGTYSEIEKLIIDEQPKNLWPENQNSNFGAVRKVFSDRFQECSDVVTELFNEFFVATANKHLYRHEFQYDLPVSPSGRSLAQRRTDVLTRIRKGPFTRMRIRLLLEDFIGATFGESVQLTPEGVPIPATGIPLYADSVPSSTLYRVYEDLANFSYAVWIHNSVTPAVSLLRELQRITPAGITVTLDNTKSNILDYQRTVLSDGPSFYWPLATTSGTGTPWQSLAGIPNVLTVQSSPTNIGALIQNGGGVIGDTQARSYDGVDDSNFAPNDSAFGVGRGGYSLEAWVRIDAFPSPGNYAMAMSHGGEIYGGCGWIGVANYSGANHWSFRAAMQIAPDIPITAEPASMPVQPSIGPVYHIVGTWTGTRQRFYVNGVKILDATYNITNPRPFYPNGIALGRYWHQVQHFFNGDIDEPAFYGYPLSDEQVLRHYNTGINVA